MELRASFITSDKISLEHFPWVTPILKEPCVCVVTHIWQEVGGKTTKRLKFKSCCDFTGMWRWVLRKCGGHMGGEGRSPAFPLVYLRPGCG